MINLFGIRQSKHRSGDVPVNNRGLDGQSLYHCTIDSDSKPSVVESFVIPDDLLGEILMFIENDDECCLNFQLTCWNWYKVSSSYRYKVFDVPSHGKYIFYQGVPNCFYMTIGHLENNYSSYKVPSRNPWSWNDRDVLTRWYKLRVNPENLMIHTGDFRFSKSTGQCSHHSTDKTMIPYASCFGCEGGFVADGKAKCDIRGTPFKFKVDFFHDGYCSNGTWKFSNQHQEIDISGGGYCGWTCPIAAKNEKLAVEGGWFVQLEVNV